MQLEEHAIGDVVIVSVNGNITSDSGHNIVLRDKVRSLLQQGHKKLVLDLGGVGFMDSAGLGELVQAYATTKNKDGMLKLARTTARLNDLLAVTKLVTVFDNYKSVDEAVTSFA
ncbi:MAG TPA: STAS domain-containing protein [Vicinamibacterales bacterium]|jgi:anti-sigma B factor antagonist|nr:STAS domain-containing protein [Vicinamibacterales bacterium]